MFRDYPSHNCGPRRGGVLPDLIVLHYTAMASCAAAEARLCDPDSQVSAHYLISEAGAVLALVPEELRAWHAGAGAWGAVTDVNSRAIGVELANDGAQPFAEPQMVALEALLADVMRRWQIPAQRLIAHSDMAPGRKTDPGARFDWRRLALAGLSVWPEVDTEAWAGPARADAFQEAVHAFGYSDGDAQTLLATFRLRFRPWETGPLDVMDVAMARDLARRYPVGRFSID
ncbi:MAG: N-acetylmuramoyl-L-alanine amidase [Pseudorhodobacter sp.]|nr:N-acetylmuramoyl-L-alanine amidase [Pseudorhodobacter sp.]